MFLQLEKAGDKIKQTMDDGYLETSLETISEPKRLLTVCHWLTPCTCIFSLNYLVRCCLSFFSFLSRLFHLLLFAFAQQRRERNKKKNLLRNTLA